TVTHADTNAIHTLSLHDALPICSCVEGNRLYARILVGIVVGQESNRLAIVAHEKIRALEEAPNVCVLHLLWLGRRLRWLFPGVRSEEHTSVLQSRENIVCRLLLD